MAVNELIVTPEFLSQEIPLQTELESNILTQEVGSGGGGKVQSVNGMIGDVVLTAEDIGYDDTTIADALGDKAAIIIDSVGPSAVASFIDGAGGAVKSLVVNIETAQSGSGDASPTNIRKITGRTAVNGYHGTSAPAEFDTGYYYSDTGSLSTSNYMQYETVYLPVLPGANYTFKFDSTGTRLLRVHEYDESKTWLRQVISQTVSTTTINYSPTADARFIRFSYPIECGKCNLYTDTISATFPTAAGNVYGGTLNLTTGVLTVNYQKITMTGVGTSASVNAGESFTGKGSATAYNVYYTQLRGSNNVAIVSLASDMIGKVACSHAMPVIYSDLTADIFNVYDCVFTWNMPAGTPPRIQTRLAFPADSEIDTLAKANEFLADQLTNGTPVEYTVPMATPVTYQLTPQEISTFLRENSFWFDCGPTSVEYPADTKLYIQKVINAAIAAL